MSINERLLTAMRTAADEAEPYKTAVIAKGVLHLAINSIEDQNRRSRRDRNLFYIACVLGGLFFSLWYVAQPPAACPAPSELTNDASVRSFDPFTKSDKVWL